MAEVTRKAPDLSAARPVAVEVAGETFNLQPTIDKADTVEAAFGSPYEAMQAVLKMNRRTMATLLLACSQDRAKASEVKGVSDVLFGLTVEERGEVAAKVNAYLAWMANGFQGTVDNPGAGKNEGEGETGNS